MRLLLFLVTWLAISPSEVIANDRIRYRTPGTGTTDTVPKPAPVPAQTTPSPFRSIVKKKPKVDDKMARHSMESFSRKSHKKSSKSKTVVHKAMNFRQPGMHAKMRNHSASKKIRRMDHRSGTKKKGEMSNKKNSKNVFSKKSSSKGKKSKSKGKNKGKSKGKSKSKESSTPPSPPSIAPIAPPSNGITECVPTSGECISSFRDLNQAFASAGENEVIAICSDTTISAQSMLSPIRQSGVTLCCFDQDCRINLENEASLRVFGESFTISNLRLSGGTAGLLGGQLTIRGRGDHLIESSIFENAASGEAAVYIETMGTLTVTTSEFVESSSAGLVVLNAGLVQVEAAIFSSNGAEGMQTTWNDRRDTATAGQNIDVTNSIFTSNGGDGLVATNLGKLPKLSITFSYFVLNGNRAGTFCCATEYDAFVLSSNSGFDNMASVCQGFLVYGIGPGQTDTCFPIEASDPQV